MYFLYSDSFIEDEMSVDDLLGEFTAASAGAAVKDQELGPE